MGPASRAAWSGIRAHAETRPGGVGGLSGTPGKSAILPIVRPRLLALALFLGAALISGFTIRRGIDPFDEGLMLSTVDRLLRGQTPYQDFIWPYGPGQPYLLAAVAELTDRSLLWWRILRVACDAGVALLVFTMLRGRVPLALALAGWLCAACAMAQPVSANPFPAALLAGLGAFAVITARPPGRRAWLWAGLLCGLAAAWRLDFGLYSAGASGLAVLLRPDRAGRERVGEAARFAGAAVVTGLVLYVPFLVAAGPAEMYDQLVATASRERDYWTLPFPLGYDGPFSLWPPGTAAERAKDVLGFYVPLLVLVGVALGVVSAAVAGRARGAWLAGAVALGAGGAVYMFSRADEFHSAPGVVALALALPVCVYAGRGAGRAARILSVAALAVLALLTVSGVLNRASALLQPQPYERLALPVADGVRARPTDARALPQVVAAVQRRVPPGRPIYTTGRRSDIGGFNNPLLYVLADRPNVLGRDVGLFARPAGQRRIVAALRRERPGAVVRWTDPLSARREPNRRGRSSGSRAVDEYLSTAYRPVLRAGYYRVLVPRG